MNILDLINKKKNGLVLTEEEYNFFVTNFVKNKIPDYQAAAFLMSIRLKKMTADEIYFLTKAMLNSGKIIEPIATNSLGLLVDKHSSGGVGDKVTLILSPILASLGYDVAKMSGRGLSFTGGTIDKQESIGINCKYNEKTYQLNLEKDHMILTMQGDNIVPADKKIYALRDVTGTVDSVGLIASSIMSKKLAIKTDYIFIDLKVGNGAFCKNIKMAQELADAILDISKRFNRKTVIHLTQMSTPLGKTVGNKIEVYEALEFLKNNFLSKDLKDLIFKITTDILTETKVCKTKKEATEKINEVLSSFKAYEIFLNYIKNHNGNYKAIKENTFFNPRYSTKIVAPSTGYVEYLSAKEVGMIAAKLGAGRFTKEDILDFNAGIMLNVENNGYVEKDSVIATLYSDKRINKKLVEDFLANIKIKKNKMIPEPMILGIIK